MLFAAARVAPGASRADRSCLGQGGWPSLLQPGPPPRLSLHVIKIFECVSLMSLAGMQPPDPAQPQPTGKRRRPRGGGGKRAKRAKRGAEGPPLALGYFGTVPSLHELQAANRQATKRYFNNGRRRVAPRWGGGQQPHGSAAFNPAALRPLPPTGPPRAQRRSSYSGWRRGAPTPHTVPPAPTHLTFPHVNSDPLLTPAAPPAVNGEQAVVVDKLAADGLNAAALNMYGTNDGGMFFQRGSPSSSEGALSEGELGSDVDEAEQHQHQPHHLPRHIRARLAEQEAIIAELEDENLR